MPVIRIPGALRGFTGGEAEVVVTAATVRDSLVELDRKHPGIAARVIDAASSIKPYVRIYVGAEDIGALAGLDTAVGERDEIAIVPAIAGGAAPPAIGSVTRGAGGAAPPAIGSVTRGAGGGAHA